MEAVEVQEIRRVFTPRKREPVTALADVSLTIPVGEVHGLLGPNGAGKTTLVKILSTVLLPTDGRALVCGHDVVTETKSVRPLIGIVFGGERGVYIMADGVFSALLGLFILGPAFGLHFPFPRILLVIPLTLLVGLSAYAFSTFLAGVIIKRRETTGLIVNTTYVTFMALCGVNVPVSFYPSWLKWISRCLPLTNGLEAIRDVVKGGAWPSVGAHAGAELLVLSVWLSLALATFGLFMRSGQRDGSLEYAA